MDGYVTSMVPALCTRLAAVAALVPEDGSVADIGTDHGLLPCFLMASGAVTHAVASDVSAPSLDKARARIERLPMDVRKRIAVRCGDGLSILEPGEVSTVVIAGMGGQTMCRILQNDVAIVEGISRLVLSPNCGAESMRRVLVSLGWTDVQSAMVRDRAHFYPVEAWEQGSDSWTDADFRWGRHMRADPGSGLTQFLMHEYTRLLAAREAARRGLDAAAAAVMELSEEVARIEVELLRLRDQDG